MQNDELKRLQKIETRIYEIARENGLEFCDIEFDVIPAEKMFEIMAYGIPGQIRSWKYGRDYEKTRTMYEKFDIGLPYEVVVNTDPARAYLMKDNTIGLQALIIAHVVAHVAFFTMNKYHAENDSNIASRLINASNRIDDYTNKYGIDIVEQTIDAGHAIMWHSNPWISDETEEEKLERIFEQKKKIKHEREVTTYDDFFEDDTNKVDMERERYNNQLYVRLKNRTPIEPTEDLLRYIIDNSRNISTWQKDILEIIRSWGQYVWPNIKTKYMNEGFATYWHEKILRQLFQEKLLDEKDHGDCNYSNALVKAKNPFSMNPYLIGSAIWEDIVERWDKGRHGTEYEEIKDFDEKLNYDDKSMKGMEKMFKVLRTSNDWMFMHNFLTPDLVRKLQMYLYVKHSNVFVEELVITDKTAEEVCQIIIRSFAHSGIPKIFVKDGNFEGKNNLLLVHEHIGADLDPEYAQKTLEHVRFLWGENCYLTTFKNKTNAVYVAK